MGDAAFVAISVKAVLAGDAQTSGTSISAELESRADRRVSRGALYSSLDRLERKGLLRWSVAASTSERGGQPVREFELTEAGLQALRTSMQALMNLSSGIENKLRSAG